MKRIGLVCVCTVLVGCAGAVKPVDITTVADSATLCFSTVSPDIGQPCFDEISTTTELGQRDQAGNALLAAIARTSEKEGYADAVKIALWVNPNPSLPEAVASTFSAYQKTEIPAEPIPKGAILVFEGGQTNQDRQYGHPVIEIPLRIPSGDGPLRGDSLAAAAVAAVGGVAGIYNGDHAVPAAPLLHGLIGLTTASSPGTLQAAVRVGEADLLLRNGQLTESFFKLKDALAALPESAPPCQTRGVIIDAIRRAGHLASADLQDFDTMLHEVCLEAEDLTPQGQHIRDYLQEQLFFETNWANIGLESRPERWLGTKDRAEYAQTLNALGKNLGVHTTTAARLDLFTRWNKLSMSEPTSTCDEAFSAQAKIERDTILAAFDANGRRDLALSIRTRSVLNSAGQLHYPTIKALTDWADQPRNRWLRQSSVTSGLLTGSLVGLTGGDTSELAPLCTRVYEELKIRIAQDTFEGFDERNTSRVLKSLLALTSCPDPTMVEKVVDEALARAVNAENGHAGVLTVFAGAGANIIQSLFSGQMQNVAKVLYIMSNGLQKAQKTLGSSTEDKALSAMIDVARSISGWIIEGSDPRAQMVASAKALGQLVPAKADPNAPTITRIIPGSRMGVLGIAALLDTFDGNTSQARQIYAEMDGHLQSDLQLLLANFEAPDHSAALAQIVRASIVVTNFSGSADKAVLDDGWKRLQATKRQGAPEEGWWAVGLDLSRVVLWDVLAFLAKDTDTQRFTAAIQNAEVSLTRLVDEALDHFEVRGSDWELLLLLPPLHHAFAEFFVADEEGLDAAQQALKTIEKPLEEALAKISNAVRQETKDRGSSLIHVLVDMADTTIEVGISKMDWNNKAALSTFSKKLEAKTSAYPPDLRMYVDMLRGIVLADVDAEGSRTAFVRAEAAIRESSIPKYAYLPNLLEARAAFFEARKPKETLDNVEKLLSYGAEARTCNKAHETHGMLPIKAWALERLGRHDASDKVLKFYKQLVQEGFTGDGSVRCKLISRRGKITANIDIEQIFGPSAPGANEGTFQVGLGVQSNPEEEGDRIVCSGAPLAAVRHDRIMSAYLTRALYAFRAGDDRVGHEAILDAIYIGDMLLHGSVQALGPIQAGGLPTSREKLYVPLLHWTVLVARHRGHLHVARQLEAIGNALKPASQTASDSDEKVELPSTLQELDGFALLPDALSLWERNQDPKKLVEAQRAIGTKFKGSSLIPTWGPALAVNVQMTWLGELEQAAKQSKKLRPPKNSAVGAATTVGWTMLLGASTSQTPPPVEEAKTAITNLSKVGLYGEARDLALKLAPIYAAANKSQDALMLLQTTRKLMPSTLSPAARLPLDQMLLSTLRDQRRAAQVMTNIVAQQQGRIPLQKELDNRGEMVAQLANAGEDVLLRQHLPETIEIFSRTVTQRHAITYRMKALLLGLEILEGKLNKEQVAFMVRLGPKVEGLAPETLALFTNLQKTDDIGEAQRLVKTTLETWFPNRAR